MDKDFLREELASLSADHRLELDVSERLNKFGEISGGIYIYEENPHTKTNTHPRWNDVCSLLSDRWEYQRLMPVLKLLTDVGPPVRTVPMTVGEIRAILNGGEDGFQ